MKLFLTFLGLAWCGLAADTAVSLAFRNANVGIAQAVEVHRTSVSEQWDLVVAVGSTQTIPPMQNNSFWWGPQHKIGLFLHDRQQAGKVYLLGVKASSIECIARVERVTATDVTISCRIDKSELQPYRKWLYDARAKKLTGSFSFQAIPVCRGFRAANGAVFIGVDEKQLVAVEYLPGREPAFRILSAGQARPWTAKVETFVATEAIEGPARIGVRPKAQSPPPGAPQLPVTRYDQFAVSRPARVKDGYGPEGTKFEEAIGPWVKSEGRIWFGKTFYDGEGMTGIGGFGSYIPGRKELQLLSPPELADWSVSAIAVSPEAVWLALVQNGEWGGSSGGLLRYDRETGAIRKFALRDIASDLLRVGDNLIAVTDFGIAVIEGEQVQRYFIDRSSDGHLRVVAGTQ